MAGHSKFKNIMHRKGAQDQKRAKIFTKAATEIMVAAKCAGIDPESNPRLRLAISQAKSINMPKDKIENAINKATNSTADNNYIQLRYEGYIASIMIIAEVLTDNKNRSAAEIRAVFNKYGGSLGEAGSVSYLFNKIGLITYVQDIGSQEEVMEAAIEYGADDYSFVGDLHEIICSAKDFHTLQQVFETKFGTPNSASIIWRTNEYIKPSDQDAEKVIKLVNALENIDDIQQVTGNFDIEQEIWQKYSND